MNRVMLTACCGAICAGLALLAPAPAHAVTEVNILVANQDTQAARAAAAKADGKTIFAETKLFKAIDKAVEVIIRNNFIMNNVLAWEADSSRARIIPAK